MWAKSAPRTRAEPCAAAEGEPREPWDRGPAGSAGPAASVVVARPSVPTRTTAVWRFTATRRTGRLPRRLPRRGRTSASTRRPARKTRGAPRSGRARVWGRNDRGPGRLAPPLRPRISRFTRMRISRGPRLRLTRTRRPRRSRRPSRRPPTRSAAASTPLTPTSRVTRCCTMERVRPSPNPSPASDPRRSTVDTTPRIWSTTLARRCATRSVAPRGGR
mmetsp:Transcript_1577/g.7013  ORF Transcript_1577/g.7013 Transcript_1577/m.7013 type:complete len:218 (+) Transcript_1577:859-1512(+)